MKKNFLKIGLITLATSLMLAGCSNSQSSEVLVNINNEIKLTRALVEKDVAPILDYQTSMFTDIKDEDLKDIKSSLVEDYSVYLAEIEILYKDAIAKKYKFNEENVKSSQEGISTTISMYFDMTLEEFCKKYNFTEDYIKECVKKQVIASEYLMSLVKIEDKDIEDYYNKNKETFKAVRASHILISNENEFEEGADSEKVKKDNMKKATQVLEKAKKGEDFKSLSDSYSADTVAQESGGDLGFFAKGVMVTEFEDVAFSKDLKVDEVYPEIVETDYGYHIIKKTGDGYLALDETFNYQYTVSEYIENEILFIEEYNKVKTELEKEYKVKYNTTTNTDKK